MSRAIVGFESHGKLRTIQEQRKTKQEETLSSFDLGAGILAKV